ncbi:MAG: ATP-binding protein [Nitrospirae bacterium]|nr:ATP-binding protein [Nitrospirota bacterium]
MIFFFGILTYLILQRERALILNFYNEKSIQTADIIANNLTSIMLDGNADKVIWNIDMFNRTQGIKVGVVGPNGLPAFNTDFRISGNIFDKQQEIHFEKNGNLFLFKPLQNEKRCHACHNPADKTRGMLVIKTSMEMAQKEINKTAKRLIFFALFLGVTSEIFLIIVLRKMILTPVKMLTAGAELLKSGKLHQRIYTQKDDEIGRLATCFNEMADSIEKSHTNLENAVRQKTKELKVVAELSSEVFKGDLALKEIIEQFLNAITDRMDFGYSSLCLIDKDTGLLLQEFKKGIDTDICSIEISLSSDHPFTKTIREAKPAIKKSSEIYAPEEYGNVVIIPILSHQRRRCRDINLCTYENCPAFNSPDDRCWLISETLCRSPQAVAGKEKIYGCLHCDVFPVLGVLIAGKKDDITKTSLHSLEILASEISSAVENHRLIDSKKKDINSLVKLHDISVEIIRNLDIKILKNSIVSSATIFANMDGAILWSRGNDGELYFDAASNVDTGFIPKSLSIDGSFAGRAIIEDRPIETINIRNIQCLRELIERQGFLYMAAVPLKFKGMIYGCLTLFKKRDFFMTDSEKAIISLFASQSAAAVNTAKIYTDLRTEKDFSEVILNSMTMGIMVLDNEGLIVKLNPIGFEILNIDDYVIGRKLGNILPQLSNFLIPGSSVGREIEVTYGNTNIPIGFTNSPFSDSKGAQIGTIVAFRDLTEIKKLQEEVRKKHRFEAMGKVIAGVAHEIRNPLFGISSIVQILAREIKSEQHSALLEAMLKEVYRLKSLVEELLLYSRPSMLNIVEIDPGILAEKIKYYISAKKNDMILHMDFYPMVTIKADMDKLTQVFLNIVDNAVGAGSKRIDIAAEKKDSDIAITIKDDGIGINKATIEKIFDPFFTTKKEGTGLGLPICKKIIEDHGGNISVQSTEGEGTTIVITLKG